MEDKLESLLYTNSEIQSRLDWQFLDCDSRLGNNFLYFLARLLFLPSESSFLFHESKRVFFEMYMKIQCFCEPYSCQDNWEWGSPKASFY